MAGSGSRSAIRFALGKAGLADRGPADAAARRGVLRRALRPVRPALPDSLGDRRDDRLVPRVRAAPVRPDHGPDPGGPGPRLAADARDRRRRGGGRRRRPEPVLFLRQPATRPLLRPCRWSAWAIGSSAWRSRSCSPGSSWSWPTGASASGPRPDSPRPSCRRHGPGLLAPARRPCWSTPGSTATSGRPPRSIYLILRRDVNGTPWHDVYLPEHDADTFAGDLAADPPRETSEAIEAEVR